MPSNRDPGPQINYTPPTLPQTRNLSKICIIIDTSLLCEETFMKSDSIIFYHPLSLSQEDCQTIAGNMYALHDILSSLQKTSIPTLIDTSEFKLGVVKIYTYFIVLSGPTDMSNETMVQQVKLFIDSMVLFLGPLCSLHIQYTPDQIRMMIRKVARHIITCIIPDRGVTFRNNVGYLPNKSNVPLDCLLRCSTLLDSLQVHGGVVIHDKKIVYTNLNSCILTVIQGLEETNVPVESIPSLEKVTIVRVFLTSKMWASLKSAPSETDSDKTVDQHSEMAMDLMLQGLDLAVSHRLDARRDSLTPIVNSFEMVSLEIPEDEFCNSGSRQLLRSFSSQHGKFSLLNELFDKKKAKDGLKRSATIASISFETFQDSLESHVSGSELPGNSLNYKLLSRDEEVIPSPSPPSPPSPSPLSPSPPSPSPPSPSLPSPSLPSPSLHSPSPPSQGEAAPDSPQVILDSSKPSDSTSGDSAYHDTLDYFIPYLENSELKVCELLIQSIQNTTIILVGENMSDKVHQYWSACLLLLGDVSGYFNVEMKAKPQKTTQGVNSFVFNKLTKTLLYSNAGKTSTDSHQQIKDCKEWCDDESDIELVGVKGLNCSTVVKNTSTANVFLTSHSMRCSKLADNISDITGRNFDSVFL